ncbi:MAG: methylmalonyl Co-A mutase-associated GTPase MeaB, partial [Marinilabiliales bacterium]|nr:methylmalonyl Co-A mutase-associated GTPase MeaB [Marinilabiliales bacterium]
TGVPGAGKSTFIESFGTYLTSLGKKLAVLAIDPSSERSRGSILGDKTRMEELSANPKAYIRPSPSSGSLGGVARKTRETILLCEAAGFDTILIETVGVGQSETVVHSMVDFFLLLQIAGAGDELQGIKRGIMEMADTIVINKADGDNVRRAEQAAGLFRNALHLFPPPPSGWTPSVLTCSSLQKNGIPEVYECIESYFRMVKTNGYFAERRADQSKYWMYETINENLRKSFYRNEQIKEAIQTLEPLVSTNKVSPFHAASQLLSQYFNDHPST